MNPIFNTSVPEEVVIHIFKQVPAESLLRSRTVSKEWNEQTKKDPACAILEVVKERFYALPLSARPWDLSSNYYSFKIKCNSLHSFSLCTDSDQSNLSELISNGLNFLIQKNEGKGENPPKTSEIALSLQQSANGKEIYRIYFVVLKDCEPVDAQTRKKTEDYFDTHTMRRAIEMSGFEQVKMKVSDILFEIFQ